MLCNYFLVGHRRQAENYTRGEVLAAGLGFGFLGGIPGSWYLLCSQPLAGSAAVGLVPGTFCLGRVEFEAAPWNQNSERC